MKTKHHLTQTVEWLGNLIAEMRTSLLLECHVSIENTWLQNAILSCVEIVVTKKLGYCLQVNPNKIQNNYLLNSQIPFSAITFQ